MTDSITTEAPAPTLKKPCPNCPPMVVPRDGYTPTRPSCIECVEKHLGAAYVLLTELNDMPDDLRSQQANFSRRLRAIGHLFEAEDESPAWPELHNAIREARKMYQQTGRSPDFDVFAQILWELKNREL